jgi:hypothetical protein
MKYIKKIMKQFFPEPVGTPLDMTPGLKIGSVVEPQEKPSFNEVFTNAHRSLNERTLLNRN